MKQYLLMLPMMCLTATASMAQTSYDTALEATVGENTYNVEGEDMQTIIWKYTAEKNSVIGVSSAPQHIHLSVGMWRSGKGHRQHEIS